MTKRILTFFTILLVAWTAASQEDQYLLPMRFDIIGDGVDQLPIEIDYDLEAKNSLRIGDAVISNETFQFRVGTLSESYPDVAPFLTEEEKGTSMLVVRWPKALIDQGHLEAIGHSGRTLWSAPVKLKETQEWQTKLKAIRDRMVEHMGRDDVGSVPLFETNWAMKDFLKSEQEFVNSSESFRFCISRINDDGSTRICSPFLRFLKRNRKWTLERQPEPEKPPRVIGYQKIAPLKAQKAVNPKIPIQFLAELSNGLIYEFVSRPPKVEIVELVADTDSSAKIVGFGPVPSREYKVLNPLIESYLARVFKWEETIGDLRRFWETSVPTNNPILYFGGPGGGLFRQQFRIKRLPPESIRPYLHRKTPDSTYVNGPWLDGVKAKETQVSSSQRRLRDGKGDEFEWSFQALKRGDLNRSHVIVESGKEKYRAYYEMYKGYPRELSFRVSALAGSQNNFILNAEGAFNYWFEDIAGWTNYYLSRQRWGMSYKFYQGLMPVRVSDQFSAKMQTQTFDLKYRFTPGLWNRDESWGMMASYNGLAYDYFNLKEFGAGIFWARSMPKLFDDLFNTLWFMRYPKWVDMEFIYYAASDNPAVNRLVTNSGTFGNWALNFHGKVLWTKSFFGEAGFGIRTIAVFHEGVSPYDSNMLRTTLNFNAFYGTVGLGYQF